jgi:hypothetical protein
MGWDNGDYDEMLDELNKIADGLGFSFLTHECEFGGEVNDITRVELFTLAIALWKIEHGL